jgi:hypothetical protein
MTDTERLDYINKIAKFPSISEAAWDAAPPYLMIALKCGKQVTDIREAIDLHAARSKE